jgi:hypothetical protein
VVFIYSQNAVIRKGILVDIVVIASGGTTEQDALGHEINLLPLLLLVTIILIIRHRKVVSRRTTRLLSKQLFPLERDLRW